jgi:hypothetical protein
VLRAIQREKSLPALRDHVARLLREGLPAEADVLAVQTQAIERCFAFAEQAAANDHQHLARQAASALYHVVTLAGLRWEAAREGLAGRALIADLVLAHRLAPRDPLTDNGVENDPRYLALLAHAPEAT